MAYHVICCRFWQYSHGVSWSDICEDLLVIDVPGDHFSLLRQEPADLEPMIATLKMMLGSYGWSEAVRREQLSHRLSGHETTLMADIDQYLNMMGIK